MIRADYNRTGITATTRATVHLGFVNIHRFGGTVEAKEVVVEEDGGAGSEWQVQLDGRNLFAQTQSVTTGTTPQSFYPDQNEFATGAQVELTFQTTNQESNSETINVGVLMETDIDEGA